MVKKDMMCKGKGVGMILLGLLIVANAYWQVLSWGMFIGDVIILLGFLKIVLPHKYHSMKE
jgi:hypothetical protein